MCHNETPSLVFLKKSSIIDYMRLVFGDISGYYQTFLKMVNQLNPTEVISLGDIIDRGPHSKECVDWFVNNNSPLIMGNHEHMLINAYESYVEKIREPTYPFLYWVYLNGAKETLISYNIDIGTLSFERHEIKAMTKKDMSLVEKEKDIVNIKNQLSKIPKQHIDFLRKSKMFIEDNNFFMSHAPISDWHNKSKLDYEKIDSNIMLLDYSCLWNRAKPRQKKDKIVIYGHENKNSVLIHTNQYPLGIHLDNFESTVPDNTWGICIDTGKGGFLTAFDLDEKQLYYELIE